MSRRSRLAVSRADIAACWANAARLQEQAGKTEESVASLATAKQVRATSAWLNGQGRRLRARAQVQEVTRWLR